MMTIGADTKKRILSLGSQERNEFKAKLRIQHSNIIDKAVKHRFTNNSNIGLARNDSTRLRRKWSNRNCSLCDVKTTKKLNQSNTVEVEHVIEQALGGGNNISNLVPCCHKCNQILGRIFNYDILQSRELRWRDMPVTMWRRLIGDWIVFKLLLYCDREIAFTLFDSFRRQFLSHYSKYP